MKLRIIGDCNVYISEQDVFRVAILGDMKLRILSTEMRANYSGYFNHRLFENLYITNEGQAKWVNSITLNEKLRATVFEYVVEVLNVEFEEKYINSLIPSANFKLTTQLITDKARYESLRMNSQYGDHGGYAKWHNNKDKSKFIWIRVKDGQIDAGLVKNDISYIGNQIMINKVEKMEIDLLNKLNEVQNSKEEDVKGHHYDKEEHDNEVNFFRKLLDKK